MRSQAAWAQVPALAFSPRVRSRWWLEFRLELGTEELFGIVPLGNGVSYALWRLAVEVPPEHRANNIEEDSDTEADEVISIASHSTRSVFGSDPGELMEID